MRMMLAGVEVKEPDPVFQDDPVWAAHQATMAKARRAAEARQN